MMRVDPTVMYKQDVKGNIRMWSVEGIGKTITICFGQLGGAVQTKTEGVPTGKATRTPEQQLRARINSRIKLQMDRGYVFDLEEARANKPTNTLGFRLPMLAQRYDKIPKLPEEFYAQYKYDGNRCLVIKSEGVVTAYSRAGKVHKYIEHILEAASDIPEGMVLDGELYVHGERLQTIRSWISRRQSNNTKLEFVCYDHMGSGGYSRRLQELRQLDLDHPIRLAPTTLLGGAEASPEALSQLMSAALGGGYEGLIVRHPHSSYEPGKRSRGLIKIKPGHMKEIPLEEEEFPVLDIVPSKDGWAIAVCGCKGGMFRVSAPGTMDEKYRAMINKELHIGKLLTVEFSHYTADGIPFHPVAIAFREPHE